VENLQIFAALRRIDQLHTRQLQPPQADNQPTTCWPRALGREAMGLCRVRSPLLGSSREVVDTDRLSEPSGGRSRVTRRLTAGSWA
jgi:hypothetical protein